MGDYFAVANPCYKENMSAIGIPDHFELEEPSPDIYQSGFYAYLVCKREDGTKAYKRYNEEGELFWHCLADDPSPFPQSFM